MSVDTTQPVDTNEQIEIVIPIHVDGVTCGFALIPQPSSTYVWSANWWYQSHADEPVTRGSAVPRGSKASVTSGVVDELKEVSGSHAYALAILLDLNEFLSTVRAGKIPELVEVEPEGDTLPSADSPLSPEDELDVLRRDKTATKDLAKHVRELHATWEDLKSQTAAAKRDWEKESLLLVALNIEGGDVLFQQRSDEIRNQPLFPPDSDVLAAPAEDEQWRIVTTSEMGLPAGIVESLANADKPIHTAGDIVAWTEELSKHGVPTPLCAVAGIGPGKAKEIDDALQACIAVNPPATEGPLHEGE